MTMSNQQPLLKEVYEKKGTKMAKGLPPWLQDKNKKEKDPSKADAKKNAIEKRMAMNKAKKKAGK